MPVDFQSSLASLLRSFAMVAGSMDGSLQRWCKILWRQFRVHILV